MLSLKIRAKKYPQYYLKNWLPPPMFKATTLYNHGLNRYPLPLMSKSKTMSCFSLRALVPWNNLPTPIQVGSAALFKRALLKNILSLILSFVTCKLYYSLTVCFRFLLHPLSLLQFLFHLLRFRSSNFPLSFLCATDVTE